MCVCDYMISTHLCTLRIKVVVSGDGNIETIYKDLEDMFSSFQFQHELESLLKSEMNELVLRQIADNSE